MITLTLNLTKKYKFDISEIYDESFIKGYLLCVSITSSISIILASLLVYTIIIKTPESMSNLKIYLLPYSLCMIFIQIFLSLFIPVLFHPYVYFYPVGIAQSLPPNLSILILGLNAYSAIALLDCCVGISLERFFVLRNIQNYSLKYSRIPFLSFVALSFSSFLCSAITIIFVFIKPLAAFLFIPFQDILQIVTSNIQGIEKFLKLESLIVFQGTDEQNSLPKFIIILGLIASSRVGLASLLALNNAYKSNKLKYLMSAEVLKNNSMLLRMSYFQFLGYFIFLFCPVASICFIYWFIDNPCIYVNCCIAFLNFFVLYDVSMTFICIKPYRVYVKNLLVKLIHRHIQHKTVIIPRFVL